MADGFATYRCVLEKTSELAGKKISLANSSAKDIADAKNDLAATVGLPGGVYLADVISSLVEGGKDACDEMVTKRYGVAAIGVAEALAAIVVKLGCGTVPGVVADAPVSTAGRVVAPSAFQTLMQSGALKAIIDYQSPTQAVMQAYRANPEAFALMAQRQPDGAQQPGGEAMPGGGLPGDAGPVVASQKNTALLVGAAAIAALLFLR